MNNQRNAHYKYQKWHRLWKDAKLLYQENFLKVKIRTLFRQSYETKADGMILVCDNDKKRKIAENIIRHTMWNRKSLLNANYTERNKPVRYSRSPIKLRIQYEHVYITTTKELKHDLIKMYDDILHSEKVVMYGFKSDENT